MPDLSSTSALVLLWAGQESFKSKLAKDYFNLLDLKPCKVLYERCNEICPYYDEIIKNRKFGIYDLIAKSLISDDINQIIIAGAGLDPLAIEVTEFYPKIKVFELDVENMDKKSFLYSKLKGNSNTAISFINTNLQNVSEVYKSLIKHGWDTSESTLLILEGISYYLPTASLQNIIKVIKPKRAVFFKFLKPNDEINKERGRIADKVFGIISDAFGRLEIIRYSNSYIESQLGLPVITPFSMKNLERLRTGSNKYFPTDESGWIEVSLLGN